MNIMEIEIVIPDGYKIIEKKEELDIFSACDKLRSRKQKYITYAKRVGDRAILTTHRIKCPHCAEETPSYAHCWSKYAKARSKKSEVVLSNWAEIQLSIMDEPEEELTIQPFEEYSGEYICAKCGFSSNKANNDIILSVKQTDGKLYIKREIKNLSELVSVKWLAGVENICFPIYEQVVFDFDSSIAYMELISQDRVICTTIVTDSESDFEDDKLINLFAKNIKLKRTVKRVFEELTGYKIPYTANKLDFYKFVSFLRFRGFPEDFYTTIPFWGDTNVIDGSFNEIAQNLTTPESAMTLLEESSIPFCKSVKRLFAKKSGLFFYLRECEFLFSVFNDVNLFCAFLNKTFIFHFLSMMHYYEYPLKTFLMDYSCALGKTRFAQKITHSDNVINYAIHYASLSGYVQKKEQERWISGVDTFDDFNLLSHRLNNISVPIPFVLKDMKDCIIDKHRFKYLRTKHDCVVVGEKMKNCLVNWDSYSNPVVVVYKGERILAAVEISNNEVFQAKARQNKSISLDSDLYSVIKKWCKINKIKIEPEELDGPFVR